MHSAQLSALVVQLSIAASPTIVYRLDRPARTWLPNYIYVPVFLGLSSIWLA